MLIGQLVGSYEVLAKLGEGGMGEVYRARDTKLNRDVALKVLPDLVAADPERLARFHREAQVLASLNHPNIAQIHGFEDSGATHALVMELVEGPTLAEKLPRSDGLPIPEALNIARQLAEALEAAHEVGIVHRDLKPANIKVRDDGAVKVLDFGLAKAMDSGSASLSGARPSLSMSPTLTSPALMTGAGIILGTAAYMAPEQARGRTVDRRADIWAFGAVLYEMLTGKRPFEAEDVSATLAYVITKEPDWSALPAATPAAVRKLLRRCLEKDPKKRLQSIGDARLEIEDALSGSPEIAAQPLAGQALSAPRSRRRWPWIAATAVASVVAAVASLIAYRATRPIDRPLIRLSDQLEAGISLQGVQGPALALSPDGSRLAYVTSDAAQITHLSIRNLNDAKTIALANTDGADAPFFSPDGRWIGYFTRQGAIQKISVDGGAAVAITETKDGLRGGATWADDGTIFFAGLRTPILRVPASGGTPGPVTQLEGRNGPTEPSHRAGQLLPNSVVLFEASKDRNFWEDATIEVQSLKTGQRKTLVQGGYFGRYIPGTNPSTGHLIYVHGDTVFAAPMDTTRLELTGVAVPILQRDVARRNTNGIAHLAVTPSGTMVYVSGGQESYESFYWQDAAGTTEVLRAPPSLAYMYPRVSPDGLRIAAKIMEVSGGDSLGIYEWAENRMTRLALKGVASLPVAWTPDGKHLAVKLDAEGPAGPGLYWVRADGAGEPQLIVAGDRAVGSAGFSPDGRRFVFAAALPGSEPGLWTVSLDMTDPEHPKGQKPEVFVASKTPVRDPAFSPDGRWLAYTSVESGGAEIVVRPFPGPGGKWQVSAGGGDSPVWSQRSRELLYRNRRTVMAVSYSVTGDSFSAGQPRTWSSSPIRTPSSRSPDFDLSRDGTRVLSSMPASAASGDQSPGVTFLLNFADELRRKAPLR